MTLTAVPTMTPDELAAFVAEQTQEKPRYICTVCGGPKVKAQGLHCQKCWKKQRHKQQAMTIRGRVSPPRRDTGGHRHWWLLPSGAGMGPAYEMRCRTCGETRTVTA